MEEITLRLCKIPGYDNYYVSDEGHVLKMFRPSPNKYGHLETALSKDGRARKVLVHQLVAENFVEKKPFPGAIVLHNDDVKANNSAKNLRWGTHKDISEASVKDGLYQHGVARYNSKLTDDAVREIRLLSEHGIATKYLSDKYGVAESTIVKVMAGKAWAHVQ